MPQARGTARGRPEATKTSSRSAASIVARRASRASPDRYSKSEVWKTSAMPSRGSLESTRGSSSTASPRTSGGGSARTASMARSSRASRSSWPTQTNERSRRAPSSVVASTGTRSMPTRERTRGSTLSSPAGTGRRSSPASLSEASGGPPFAGPVAIAVAVPDEVQAGARAKLDDVHVLGAGGAQEQRQQHPGALHLVRLHRLLGDEPAKELAVLLERRVDVVPARLPAEDEVVEPAEDLERNAALPALGQRAHAWIRGEPPAELCVQRRAALAVGRLFLESLSLAGQAFSAALACSASSPNAAGSLTARSARIFRSRSISALRSPETSWLYERSCARAAALIRVIQSRRKTRFLFLRSR